MKKTALIRFLVLIAFCAMPLVSAFAQREWTYVVTGKVGREGLPAYNLGGGQEFVLHRGDKIEISSIQDDFPVPDSPGETRRAAVITRDMEDYIIYLDEDGLIVPQSKYRYERILPGLGDLVNRNPAKNHAMLYFGLAYLLMMLYASHGLFQVSPRGRRLTGFPGWTFFTLYLVLLGCETYYLLTYTNPFWFMRLFEVGFFKGLLFLLLMIVYLYLKYMVTLLALYPLRTSRRLACADFNFPRALLITVAGTWLILSMVYWETDLAPYLMGIVAVATFVWLVRTLRPSLRHAGVLLSFCILAIVLVSGATLCYVLCEVLATIVQIIVIGFCIYALIASRDVKLSFSSDSGDHVSYVDFDGNYHDLYRQSNGTYVDYNENSFWNKVEGGNSDRFDRIS